MRFGEVTAFVSLVIPCLNEEAAFGAIVGDCLAMGVDEVIVVDGGSTDATAKKAAATGARIVVETRRGYGRACAAGVSAVAPETEIIAFMDGDVRLARVPARDYRTDRRGAGGFRHGIAGARAATGGRPHAAAERRGTRGGAHDARP